MKMNVRRKKKSNLILKLIVIILVSVFCAFALIRYYSNNISPIFMVYAEDEVSRIVSIIVNDSINNEIVEKLNSNDIFEIVRNIEGFKKNLSY